MTQTRISKTKHSMLCFVLIYTCIAQHRGYPPPMGRRRRHTPWNTLYTSLGYRNIENVNFKVDPDA